MKFIRKIAGALVKKETIDKLTRRKIWPNYQQRLDDAINNFVIGKGVSDVSEINLYKKKLKKAFVKDNWYPEEYFWFNYERLSEKGIKCFVPWREAALFWNSMNSKQIYELTCDKGETYNKFRAFYHRDVVSVPENNQQCFSQFLTFVENHKRFIVKPLFGNYGNGCKIVDSTEWNNADKEFETLLREYEKGFVAEELIIQCKEMSDLHPSSVNTVRITTVRKPNGDVYVIHRPFMRIGRGGRCVDNGGNGGIIALIDYETGIVKGAIDESMERFVVHPDSGKTILGYQVPQWNELKKMAVEVAGALPELKYCGWDFALTEKGWVMVEANGKGLFIGFQMPTQEGFREEFETIKKMCGYKG